MPTLEPGSEAYRIACALRVLAACGLPGLCCFGYDGQALLVGLRPDAGTPEGLPAEVDGNPVRALPCDVVHGVWL